MPKPEPTPAPVAPDDEPVPEDAGAAPTDDSKEVQELVQAGVRPRIDLAAELKKVEEGRGTEWTPKTRLGKLVRSGEITSMSQALASGLRLREAEIVDVLLPGIGDEVTSVNMVQRMTDSGRRVRFSIQAVVGNRDGFVGIGMATGKEVGPTIRRASSTSSRSSVVAVPGNAAAAPRTRSRSSSSARPAARRSRSSRHPVVSGSRSVRSHARCSRSRASRTRGASRGDRPARRSTRPKQRTMRCDARSSPA